MRQPEFNIPSRTQEESRIAASWLQRLQGILQQRDPVLFEMALDRAGIRRQDLESAQNIHLEQLDAAQLFAREQYPDITLRMYHASDLLDMGLIGYAMASSGTVQRAWEIGIKYHDLTSDRYQLELIEDGDQAIIRQVPFLGHLPEFVDMGEELAGVVKILENLVGSLVEHQHIEVCFEYPAPEYADAYSEVFGGPIRFASEHSEIRFPISWLQLPVATANASTSAVCASMCERVLSNGTMVSNTAESVKRLLVSRAGREVPTLEQAADLLRLSVSQLRKRLYRDQTSYKQLVLEVRMTLARHYLQATTLSVQEIAYLLDYSQAAPFSRAFKAYFGFTPQQCRTDS